MSKYLPVSISSHLTKAEVRTLVVFFADLPRSELCAVGMVQFFKQDESNWPKVTTQLLRNICSYVLFNYGLKGASAAPLSDATLLRRQEILRWMNPAL